jgi:hypothetical protein
MSGKNRVNPDHYKVAGRLTPDDLARERRKQTEPLFGATRSGRTKPAPPWLTGNEGGRQDVVASDSDDGVSRDSSDADEAAQQPQARPRPNAKGKQAAGGGNQRKTARRESERRRQATGSGTTRGARSVEAKPRSKPKTSGASGTPKGGKAPRTRGSAARAASPQRAGRPAARKTKSRGTQKATPKKGTRAAAKKSSSGGKKKTR